MIIHIPLDRIQPNPWQTRQGLNESHIRDLAASILKHKAGRHDTLGLLQVPGGRLVRGDGATCPRQGESVDVGELGSALSPHVVQENGYRVQLTYGHNRAAAFRLLVQGDGDAFPGDYDPRTRYHERRSASTRSTPHTRRFFTSSWHKT